MEREPGWMKCEIAGYIDDAYPGFDEDGPDGQLDQWFVRNGSCVDPVLEPVAGKSMDRTEQTAFWRLFTWAALLDDQARSVVQMLEWFERFLGNFSGDFRDYTIDDLLKLECNVFPYPSDHIRMREYLVRVSEKIVERREQLAAASNLELRDFWDGQAFEDFERMADDAEAALKAVHHG